MPKNKMLFAYFLLLAFCFQACDLGGGDKAIPAYLSVNSFDFQTQEDTQGSNSSKFTDVQVYINNQNIGIYPLPASIPVLSEGLTKIDLKPVFWKNGISALRTVSLLHTFYTENISLSPDQTYTIEPTVTYVDDAEFPLISDFELGNPFVATENSVSLQTTADAEIVFAGERSFWTTLQSGAAKDKIEMFTGNTYAVDLTQKRAYIEMDYRCDAVFEVFMNSLKFNGSGWDITPVHLLYLNTRSDWNHVYFDLTDAMASVQGDAYNFGLSMELPDSLQTASLGLDNFKIVFINR
ncbi:MAG: hypothetical protein R2798_00365 [Chitinophagales bacterium]|nr:hypothetical protein [Bacteroidota bacterium]MCB9043852.1 hypothetical protein [Chitinophagales bacterium]